MSKYDPLRDYLARSGDGPLDMTFRQIEDLVGGLPQSAYRHPAWWSNEAIGGTHVQSRAWLDAGWKTEALNLTARTVTFTRARL